MRTRPESITFTYDCPVCDAQHEATLDTSDVSYSLGFPGNRDEPPSPPEVEFMHAPEPVEPLPDACREFLAAFDEPALIIKAEDALWAAMASDAPDEPPDAYDLEAYDLSPEEEGRAIDDYFCDIDRRY